MKTFIYSMLILMMTISQSYAHIQYDPSAAIEKQKSLLSFWSAKAEASPMSHDLQIKLSNVNTTLFQLTGDGSYLLAAQRNLNFTADANSLSRSIGLCLLAQNLITQHKFCQAYDIILEAAMIGRDQESVNLILFDIEYELGYDTSETLAAIDNKSQMDYLIRLAKQHKKEGDYGMAIHLLRSCKEQAAALKKYELIYWLDSNIAELYIEKGNDRVAKKILKDLNKQYPNEWYAYKLLAKLEYKNNNLREALDIVSHVLEFHKSPELSILKHRITHELDGDEKAVVLDSNLHDLLHDPLKGSMYATHAAKELLLGNSEERRLALELAIHEVEHRSTLETLALLAYAYYKNDQTAKAKDIALTELKGKNLKNESQEYIDEILYENKVYGLILTRGLR